MEPATSSDVLSVVYIEDDPRIARLTAKYLETHGIVVTLAADGVDGVTAVTRERPDVVLLDLMLPGIDPSRSVVSSARARACPSS